MIRVLLDADASIKLTKIGIIETVFDKFVLGRGEKSVINYYLGDDDIDLIVSDDEASLKVLDRFDVPFTPVAGVILMCVIHDLVSKEKGFRYLESLRPMIKDEHMFYMKCKIEELL